MVCMDVRLEIETCPLRGLRASWDVQNNAVSKFSSEVGHDCLSGEECGTQGEGFLSAAGSEGRLGDDPNMVGECDGGDF